MKRIGLLCVVFALVCCSWLAGCSAVSKAEPGQAPYQQYNGTAQDTATAGEGSTGETADANLSALADAPFMPADAQADQERKIVWTVDMEVETLEFDNFLAQLDQAVQEFGGYLESSSVSGNSIQYASSRNGALTVRIPSQQLDAFLSQVGQIGTVTYTNKSSEDITLDYIDVESRIAALEVEQERLLSLLEQADDLNSVIQLESRLSEVRYQLESYRSTQNRYDSMVDYSTVTINAREVQRVTTVHDQSVGQRIAAGWSDTLYQLKQGVTDLFVWFVVNLPYFLIWAVLAGIVVLVVLRFVKKRKRQEKDQSEKQSPIGPVPPPQ